MLLLLGFFFGDSTSDFVKFGSALFGKEETEGVSFLIGVVFDISVLLQLRNDFSEDLACGLGEFWGLDTSSLGSAEVGFKSSDSDIDSSRSINTSGNSG